MFKKLKFLCAIRTAPGHSYINIVERIMSILNLGFQNITLERQESPLDCVIEECKNIRNPAFKIMAYKKYGPLTQRLHNLALQKGKELKTNGSTTGGYILPAKLMVNFGGEVNNLLIVVQFFY